MNILMMVSLGPSFKYSRIGLGLFHWLSFVCFFFSHTIHNYTNTRNTINEYLHIKIYGFCLPQPSITVCLQWDGHDGSLDIFDHHVAQNCLTVAGPSWSAPCCISNCRYLSQCNRVKIQAYWRLSLFQPSCLRSPSWAGRDSQSWACPSPCSSLPHCL